MSYWSLIERHEAARRRAMDRVGRLWLGVFDVGVSGLSEEPDGCAGQAQLRSYALLLMPALG